MSKHAESDLSDKFAAVLNSNTAADLQKLSTRRCTSDNYDGIEYTFYGPYIPVRPIIDVVAEEDGYGIEQIGHVDEGDPRLLVFVADLPEQEHPAFVN